MTRFRPTRRVFALALLAALAQPALADHSESCGHAIHPGRPSIGLVLGGGGARGAAHIGVIKKLEELQIPIDFIAGTSMGALVGALYATGLSAAELEQTMLSLDWDDLFDDQTQRQDRPVRRKRDDYLGLFGPKVGVSHGRLTLTRGAISGQKISFLFETMINQRVQVDDFAELPIPFKAIAADLISGETVVLERGNLGLAMRASMSVPGFFDPVELDGRLLVDGGIANNIPIDVAKAAGAQRVIVVDTSTLQPTIEEVTDVVDVVDQLSNLLVQQNARARLALLTPQDVFIRPDLGKTIKAIDFDQAARAIEIGYQGATDVEAALGALAVEGAEFERYRATVSGCPPPQLRVDFVELNNQSRFGDAVIQELLDIPLGQPLDVNRLEYSIRQIYASGFLQQVSYQVVQRDGSNGVHVDVYQDQRGTQFIEWGLDYIADDSDSKLSLRVGFLKSDLDELGSEFRVTGQIGDSPGLLAELYKPLDTARRWTLSPRVFAVRSDYTEYDTDGNGLRVIQQDSLGGSLQFAREFGRHAALSVGLRRETGQFDVEIGDHSAEEIDFDDARLQVTFAHDRLDDLYFPSHGSLVELSYSEAQPALGGDFGFDQVQTTLAIARSLGRHNLIGLGRYATTLDNDAPLYGLFRAGGFTRLSGFNEQELAGQHFGMVLAGYRYEIGRTGLLPAYVGTTLEYGNVAARREDIINDAVFAGSLYLGYQSPIGPLYFGLAKAEGGRNRIFLRVGTVLNRGGLDQ